MIPFSSGASGFCNIIALESSKNLEILNMLCFLLYKTVRTGSQEIIEAICIFHQNSKWTIPAKFVQNLKDLTLFQNFSNRYFIPKILLQQS